MFREEKSIIIIIFISLTAFAFISPLSVHAQYWMALPPYNLLWPLWCPQLSPVEPLTGLPIPLISSLTSSTILPVQPAWVWDPVLNWLPLLYNSPTGLLFFDLLYGLNPFPPSNLIDPYTATPLPIVLPLNYSSLAPLSPDPIVYILGNLTYSFQYGVPLTDLLPFPSGLGPLF